MFERKVLPAALVLALLVPGASFAGSILRFFQDGCAVTDPAPDLVQICEQGTLAGVPCTQDPSFSPPSFSLDCCRDLDNCVFEDPNSSCSDPSPPRTCVSGTLGKPCVTNAGCDTATDSAPEGVQICEVGARAGAPCTQDPSFPPFSQDCCRDFVACLPLLGDPNQTCSDPSGTCVSGTLGKLCVTNASCDSFVCIAGDPDTVGESCTVDVNCGNPVDFPEVECGPTSDGVCGEPADLDVGVCGEPADLDTSSSTLGNVLQVNDDTYLLAVVTGVIQIPQPSYNKKDRRQVQFDFQLIDKEDLLFTDPEFCKLAVQLGEPLRPTEGILENGTSP